MVEYKHIVEGRDILTRTVRLLLLFAKFTGVIVKYIIGGNVMSKPLTEQKVLRKLGIQDFRHLTKDKVITMASMLDKVDPEVAKKQLNSSQIFLTQ